MVYIYKICFYNSFHNYHKIDIILHYSKRTVMRGESIYYQYFITDIKIFLNYLYRR